MLVTQDSASFRNLWILHVWIISRLWLISRARESASHQTTLPSAPNKDSSSPLTAGPLRSTRSTARPPRISTASPAILPPDDEIGQVKSALLSFGPVTGKYESTVLGLGIGCFGELPAGFNGVCTFIARSRALSYMDRYDDKSPKEALCMFRSRICRAWGHAAVFAWSNLNLDRSRVLQSPASGTVLTPVRGERTGLLMSGVSFLGFV